METVLHLLAVVGLASPLAVAHFLDRILKAELKERLSIYIFGSGHQTVSERVSLFNALLAAALGRGFLRRLIRLCIIGFVSIFFVYSAQYFFSNEEFDKHTLPFLVSIISLRPFSVFVVISFVLVDAISFFQTVTFSRLIAYCKNPVEVIFLAVADVVVSLFLVLIFLPVFLYVSHRVATVPHDAKISIVLLESVQRQQMSLSEIIMLAAPRVERPDESENELGKEALAIGESGWIYSNPRLFVSAKASEATIERAIDGKMPSAGGSLLFTRGDLTAAEIASSISALIEASPGITEARVNEAASDLFGNGGFSFFIEGRSQLSGWSFLTSYSSIMQDINFFGGDFAKAVSLQAKTVDENEITYTGFLSGLVREAKGEVVYVCDGRPVKKVDRSAFLMLSDADCVKGVAMSAWSTAGISSLLSYNFENQLMIPVLPTALSSIFLTIIIYICTVVWICLPYFRSWAEAYTTSGARMLTDNIFTVSFLLLSAIASPFFAYFMK
ncbi:hypothetical protein [Aliirhizobium smilacinae]|uniref:Uncharacterized protein n=1 Tax=Aliirhizobium smilacinae TaxID=1395944 RepID=A0A5C4XS31_9HYPH|nr:hypothetical protein [Rhizobium smilacinae]TNM66225.1 hypothetical protein FHP24_08480 [Rhizobium smilacinae]